MAWLTTSVPQTKANFPKKAEGRGHGSYVGSCSIPETSCTYYCKESMKRWSGRNLRISVWGPTATRYCGVAAVTPDKEAMVWVAGFGKDHKGLWEEGSGG